MSSLNQATGPPQNAAEVSAAFLMLGTVVLIPLCYLPPLADPGSFPRLLLIQVSVTVAGLLLASAGRIGIGRPDKPALLCLGLGLVALLSLTAAQRLDVGLLACLRLFTLLQVLWIGRALSKNTLFRSGLPYALLLAGALTALFGLLQAHNLGPSWLQQTIAPASSFINRNVAAQFLVPCSCAVLPLLKRWNRTSYLVVPLLAMQVAYASLLQSRGALLAYLVIVPYFLWRAVVRTHLKALCIHGTLVLLLAAIIRPEPITWISQTSRMALPLLSIAILVALVYLGRGWVSRLRYPISGAIIVGTALILFLPLVFGSRLGAVLDTHNPEQHVNTARVRLALYTNGMAMVAAHPIFGVGAGQFVHRYPEFGDRVLATPSLSNATIPRRLHNDPLQWAVEDGLAGLLCFLGLVVLALRTTPGDWGPHLGLTAVLVHGLVSFPLQENGSAFLFWLFAGLLLGPLQGTPHPKLLRYLPVFLGNLFISGVLLIWGVSLLLIGEGQRHLQRNQAASAYTYLQHAHRIFPTESRALDQLVTIAARHAGDREAAIRVASSYTARYPHNPNGHFRLAYILKSARRFPEALASSQQAIRLAPTDAETWLLRGLIFRDAGQLDRAEAAYRHCLLLRPDHGVAREQLRQLAEIYASDKPK